MGHSNNINKSLANQLGSIIRYDTMEEIQARSAWLAAYNEREKFLSKIRGMGLKKKRYSNAVVEFDKERRGCVWYR